MLNHSASLHSLSKKYFGHFVNNILITVYNTWQYYIRRSGKYKEWKKYLLHLPTDTASWTAMQEQRLQRFLHHAYCKSPYYRNVLSDYFSSPNSKYSDIPFLYKETLLNSLSDISTFTSKRGRFTSYTGGTTGSSMKVYYNSEDLQEKQAFIDLFRESHGLTANYKIAWFSGKSLLSNSDLRRNIFYKDDYAQRTRFFSTFHINEQNLPYIWRSFENFSPRFLVGFPSSVYQLCKYAFDNCLQYSGYIEAFFPTAETLNSDQIYLVQKVLNCAVRNQYASSEGIPYILECPHGSLHIQPLSGIFEVLDFNNNPSRSGELVVTSFSTRGTPLIRYKTGDFIVLSDRNSCDCGSTFPIVESIEGRTSDFLRSPDGFYCNLGNLSNCTKGITGIQKFQVHQSSLELITVYLVVSQSFTNVCLEKFTAALRSRLGPVLKIEFKFSSDIPCENSGKYRIIKSSLDPSSISN